MIPKVVYRPPLTTVQVFAELVSQRLAQGFQLVIRPIPEQVDKGGETKGIPTVPNPNPHPIMRTSQLSPMSGITMREEEAGSEEHILSIGRVFHKIQLDGSTITVTRYRPK